MPKTTTFTTITPLPAGIRRKSVLDMYKDHMAMIDLNPLVVERFKCKPPTYTPAEEYFAAWYTIKGRCCFPLRDYTVLIQQRQGLLLTWWTRARVSILPRMLSRHT